MYIFFPLLKLSFDSNKKIFIYFIIACTVLTFGNTFMSHIATIVLNTIGLHNGMVTKNWFNIFNPFRDYHGYTFVYFCMGGLAHGLVNRIQEIPIKIRNTVAVSIILCACTALFIVGLVLSNISEQLWDVVWNGYDTAFTFVNVLMIFTLSLSYKKNYKIIRLISANTLGIYFMHIILMSFTKRFVVKIPFARSFMGCIIYSLALMILGLFLTKLLKKNPVTNKLVNL